jgi:arsenate reductase (glutaredoxin)
MGKRKMLEVYGIPTCSTCQKALKWLDAQDIAYKFINTKEAAPTTPQITQWVETLGNKLRNTSGLSYRALGVEKDTWQDADWIKAFAADAMLLKRPLFVLEDRAIYTGFRDPAALLARIK